VTVSERVSVEEHVTQDGPSIDAGKEKNAEAPPRCTIGVLVGKLAALASRILRYSGKACDMERPPS